MTGAAPLRAGVIAAGRGDRLRHGRPIPKPLVPVGGRPLIDHVLESIADADAAEVCIIINDDSIAVRDHVSAARWPFALSWIVESTPSSMHSFLRVLETVAEADGTNRVLMSTVDTIAPRGAYRRFMADAARLGDAAVALAVTTVTDDENPLLVRIPLRSWGGSIRANVFGLMILRIDYSKPLDRPLKRSYWTVSLGPTF